jgi:hypothetical protein
MSITFDYEIVGAGEFGLIYRPVAKVSFKSPTQDIWTDTWMIVDTGADFTLLPKYIAEDLGISFKKQCKKEKTSGVGGQQTIYYLKEPITAKIGDMERQIPLGFFENNEVPALLGRAGFLETFDVEFLKSRKVVFKQ